MRAHRLALRGAERPLFKDILNARPPPPELVRLTAGRDVVVVVGVAARSCEEFGCRFTGVRTGIGVWEQERCWEVGVDGRRMVYNDGLAEGSAEDVGNSIFVSSVKPGRGDILIFGGMLRLLFMNQSPLKLKCRRPHSLMLRLNMSGP